MSLVGCSSFRKLKTSNQCQISRVHLYKQMHFGFWPLFDVLSLRKEVIQPKTCNVSKRNVNSRILFNTGFQARTDRNEATHYSPVHIPTFDRRDSIAGNFERLFYVIIEYS
jgi:hypothetical protein